MAGRVRWGRPFQHGAGQARHLLLAVVALATAGQVALGNDDRPFWHPDAGTPAERFELAKRTEPELVAFLRRFPKGADLHNHAGGAVYSDYVIDAARAKGLRYDPRLRGFTVSEEDHTVSLDQLESDAAMLKAFFETVSMRGWYPNTGDGHHHFFQTFSRLGSARRSEAQVLAEIVRRNRYQHVNYVELMMNAAPSATWGRFFEVFNEFDVDDLPGSLAPFEPLIEDPSIRRSFSAYIDELEAEVSRELGLSPALGEKESDIAVGYIGSLLRTGPTERFFRMAVVVFTAMEADDRVVGLNIVAPEDHPASRRQFDHQMKILGFLWERFDKPAITLHAGELTLRYAPVASMWDRIRRSIDEGHARRIGHGISIAWERDVVGLLEQMAQDEVLVEINLTSNESILGVRDDAHPFELYRRAGVPVCLTTDDEGVSRSNLTMEYVKAVQRYDLGYEDIKTISRDCLAHSFLPKDAKAGRLAMLDAAFARFEKSLATGYREIAE
ncbi:MAG: hypothetical protein OXK76_02085 [Gammaproteobacteria bacterium]|nr:hypothetical protein [Gammaproteobacteria bacterium]